MCGICGIVSADRTPINRDTLEKMNTAIQHRGPDGDGYYYKDGVGLGMRRLAIIDVAGGDQPIANEDQTIWIIYNGEVFNFPALREELESRGHQFRTNTDTECVIHLYEEHGVDCVDHLRGQFAFALWDENRQRLLIARDRFGQKPLYYAIQRGHLYFASELSSLLTALPSRPEINLPAIDLYLSLQYIPEPHTPYKGIYKLPAAHRLVWEKGNHYLEPYWELEYEPKHTASEADLIVELRARLRQATYMRMISEVPLGAHLSGGIDSSIVVALMAEFSPEPVKTFSVGFEETGFSELPYAKSVAERYATDHQEFILTFGDIPATLEELLYHFGEPFADPSALPLFHISRITRQYVTVALNGDGGDEAFAGYLRYWLDPWANRYARLPGFINRGLIPGFAGLFPVQAEQPVGASLINGLKRLKQLTEVDPRASILRWSSYFSESLRRELWQPDMQAHLDLHAAEILHTGKFEKANAKTFLERTLYTDNTEYLPGDLLVKADRMTMANSLEGRSPFLDHELAGWAARIPQRLKLRGSKGKYILRKAFSDMLPPQVLNRGKQGFGIPVGTWMRGPLAEWSREILLSPHPHYSEWFERQTLERILDEHQKGRIDHGKRIWALVILSLWAQSV